VQKTNQYVEEKSATKRFAGRCVCSALAADLNRCHPLCITCHESVFTPRHFREPVRLLPGAGRSVGIAMRRDEVAAARRTQTGSTPDSHRHPRKTLDHWRQLAGEIRRLDLVTERILLVLEDDLGAFVRACNAR
jgi:hypothetical protein